MRTRNLKGSVLWERWRDIPNYEGLYRCSSLGKIKSLYRLSLGRAGSMKSQPERILKQTIIKGYYTAGFSKNNSKGTKSIHVMVAITFLGHVPNGHTVEVDHKNGNKLKNFVSNLQVVSGRDNSSICFRKHKETFSSKFVGVSWYKNGNKWRAAIGLNHKIKNLGYFNTEIEASNAYQKALTHINNGTFDSYLELIKPKYTSMYKGVSWDSINKRWRVGIRRNNKTLHFGSFTSELKAHEAYENALKSII